MARPEDLRVFDLAELWRSYTNLGFVFAMWMTRRDSVDIDFASGLSVFDFLKRTSWVEADASALRLVGPAAVALAEAEGLTAHARSITLRLAAT